MNIYEYVSEEDSSWDRKEGYHVLSDRELVERLLLSRKDNYTHLNGLSIQMEEDQHHATVFISLLDFPRAAIDGIIADLSLNEVWRQMVVREQAEAREQVNRAKRAFDEAEIRLAKALKAAQDYKEANP